MKIAFPYMGQVLGYKKLLEALGHEVIMPNKPTQHTFDLGVLHSPEFICYPFKVMMGTYIEVCEAGAELIVSSGGSGPCRAGMYCEVHKRILKNLGYKTEVLIFDSLFKHPVVFFKKLLSLKNKTSIFKVVKAIKYTLKLLKMLDNIDERIKLLRPYEVNSGDFDNCRNKINDMFDATFTIKELKSTYDKAITMLEEIPVRKPPVDERVRIGIVGEIYVAMEAATNMEIEKRLNALGVEVYNAQNISGWIEHNIVPKKFNKSKSWKVFDAGSQYRRCACGGHDKENTGWIIDFAENGFDGVVHLMPFGCLPELVTRSIIPQMTADLDIPILTMSIDEQNGEANTQTRLEAFVDLCRSKKISKTKVFSTDNSGSAKDKITV